MGRIGHGGGGLQDDLEGLAGGAFVDGLDVHVWTRQTHLFILLFWTRIDEKKQPLMSGKNVPSKSPKMFLRLSG